MRIVIFETSAGTTPVYMLAVVGDRCWRLSACVPRVLHGGTRAASSSDARDAMRRRTITIAAPQQRHCSLGRSLNAGRTSAGQGSVALGLSPRRSSASR